MAKEYAAPRKGEAHVYFRLDGSTTDFELREALRAAKNAVTPDPQTVTLDDEPTSGEDTRYRAHLVNVSDMGLHPAIAQHEPTHVLRFAYFTGTQDPKVLEAIAHQMQATLGEGARGHIQPRILSRVVYVGGPEQAARIEDRVQVMQ